LEEGPPSEFSFNSEAGERKDKKVNFLNMATAFNLKGLFSWKRANGIG
jgi:hypothetical protein